VTFYDWKKNIVLIINAILLRIKREKQSINACKSITYEKFFFIFLGFNEKNSFNLTQGSR
jgi:hypothetical protein